MVVSVGKTSLDPFGLTVPIPESMVMLLASITFQDKIPDSPSIMVSGSAEKETTGG